MGPRRWRGYSLAPSAGLLAMEASAACAAAAEVAADEAADETAGIIGKPGIIIGLKPAAAAAPPNSE